MKKMILFVFIISMIIPNTLLAKKFDLQKEVKKCQKCHGKNFDEQVLNVTKKISNFSKSELLKAFEGYLKVPSGGKPGLMKIIVKKYSKKEREQIVDYIYKNYKK